MISKRHWVKVVTIFALSAYDPCSPGVRAQEAECISGWEWNKNSLGQDPCYIAQILGVVCYKNSSYTIQPLSIVYSYPPPEITEESNDSLLDPNYYCQCSAIIYNLYMACTTCQGGQAYSLENWLVQCHTYTPWYELGIPQGTAVPQWAQYNVTAFPNQTYNDIVAMAVGRDPEETGTNLNTVTTVTPRSSSTSTGTPAPSLTTVGPGSSSTPIRTSSGSGPDPTDMSGDTDNGGGKSNTGAITGGAVGGIALLIILGAVAVFIKRRRQSGGIQPTPPSPQTEETSESIWPVHRPTASTLPYDPYHSAENSTTSPPPMSTGQR